MFGISIQIEKEEVPASAPLPRSLVAQASFFAGRIGIVGVALLFIAYAVTHMAFQGFGLLPDSYADRGRMVTLAVLGFVGVWSGWPLAKGGLVMAVLSTMLLIGMHCVLVPVLPGWKVEVLGRNGEWVRYTEPGLHLRPFLSAVKVSPFLEWDEHQSDDLLEPPNRSGPPPEHNRIDLMDSNSRAI